MCGLVNKFFSLLYGVSLYSSLFCVCCFMVCIHVYTCQQVTHQNSANQEYLLQYQSGIFPEKLMSLYRLCHVEVPLYPTSEISGSVQNTVTTTTTLGTTKNISTGGISTGELLVQTLLTSIKVLINLTHNSGKEGKTL